MPPLLIAAQMKPSSRTRDDSVTLKFQTKEEVDNTLFALLDNYRSVNGWLYFSPDKPDESKLPNKNAVEGEQTPSQQLRGVLWLLHMKKGGSKEDWPVFYERSIEKIRQTVIDSIE